MPPCEEAAVQGPDKRGALAGETAPVEGAEKLESEGVKGPGKSGACGDADNGALLGDAAPAGGSTAQDTLDALLSLARGGGEATVTEEASSTATAILDLLQRPNTVD